MSQLSEKALEIAISQIGKEEIPRGSNWGKKDDPVPMYLASVGIDFPASWCMAFMYWCFSKAALELGIPNPAYKTGGVLRHWRNRPNNRIFLTDSAGQTSISNITPPKPGDMFIMDLGHDLGHTGIIEKINADGSLVTIEGNTNDTGSREGYEVCRRIRQPGRPIIGCLRY